MIDLLSRLGQNGTGEINLIDDELEKGMVKRHAPEIADTAIAYLEVVRNALDRIVVGTERLLQRQSAGALTVSTSVRDASDPLPS